MNANDNKNFFNYDLIDSFLSFSKEKEFDSDFQIYFVKNLNDFFECYFARRDVSMWNFLIFLKAILAKKEMIASPDLVPALSLLIAITLSEDPDFSIHFSRDDLDELYLTAFLHDFGKIFLSSHVFNKNYKLHDVDLMRIKYRLKFLREKRSCDLLRKKIVGVVNEEELERQMEDHLQLIFSIWKRILILNRWKGFVQDQVDLIESLKADISSLDEILLTNLDWKSLLISYGTLLPEERKQIENHVVDSFEFLNLIPWSKPYEKVPYFASLHHEKLDGSGYPYGVKGEQIPIQSRILTICDMYEALISKSRGYKSALTHENAIQLLDSLAQENKIDGAILKVFKNLLYFQNGENKLDVAV